MTALLDILKARIAATGPITLADYMAECLMHPQHGYYTQSPVFGAEGDFITAPEISQMFGELIGLALAQAWMDQGRPASFTLAELGPGRGTLMADALRATAGVPSFHDAMTLCLIEASPRLRDLQAQTIPAPLMHLRDVSDLPDAPLFLIANEFFDALPIRQFEKREAWHERMVALEDDTLAFGLSGPMQPPFDRAEATSGDIVEHCPALSGVVSEVANRISANGGVALVIDYGDWHSAGDTFQALQDHQPVDPLAAPGHADLTAHVDFEAIAQNAHPAAVTAMISQGVFLERLGITPRAQALAAKMTGDPLTQHIAAHRRLTHPDEMGNLFKTIALYPQGGPVPPGFDP